MFFTCTSIKIKSRTAIKKEDYLHQQTGLKFKEQISEMLHLEHSFVWCWNWDSSEIWLKQVLKCCAEEGWRSAGPSVWRMKKYYKDSEVLHRVRSMTKSQKYFIASELLQRFRSIRRVRSMTNSQKGKELPTYNKKMAG